MQSWLRSENSMASRIHPAHLAWSRRLESTSSARLRHLGCVALRPAEAKSTTLTGLREAQATTDVGTGTVSSADSWAWVQTSTVPIRRSQPPGSSCDPALLFSYRYHKHNFCQSRSRTIGKQELASSGLAMRSLAI